ncbi:NAD(P)-dependent oxidoreductase [Arthrobacter sp. R3-55]|uniref:NAD(P)-dependent oxidoreductase n=1 Tax=Pseudarthrobacter sp. MEB009 TaxID=3040326 RepID=UPI002554B84A|nr:NAD(P)-dependent oxidoreductase [Pseudarthrobacter sp. MEB009]
MVIPDTHASLFVGLGNMGRPMAINYSPGRELFVYDTNPVVAAEVAAATNGTALPDLENIPSHVGTVILMLPNSRIIESVLRTSPGLLKRLTAGTLIIDMSSSEPESTAALAAEAAALDIDYVDAPVSGGVAKALTGKLAIMVGGDSTAVERAKRHLRNLGESITHVGPPGTGHAAKALNNLLSATNLAAAAEILTVAATAGIAPEKMLEVINGSTGRSQASEFKYPRHILTGSFDSGFAMDLMLKDLKIAKNLISQQSAEAPIVLTAQETAEKARELLDSDNPDHTEFARYYEKLNGTPLRTS